MWSPILHRDMKLANLFLAAPLFDNSPYPRAVLGDLGSATTKETEMRNNEGNPRITYVGDARWAPPENPRYNSRTGDRDKTSKYGTHGDVWQLGVSMQCLARLVDEPEKRRETDYAMKYSSALKDLMEGASRTDIKKRPTAMELLRKLDKLWKERLAQGRTERLPEWVFPQSNQRR